MSSVCKKPIVYIVNRIAFYQAGILIAFVAGFTFVKNFEIGTSVLLGEMAYALPGFIFIRSMASLVYAPSVFMAAFLTGEAIKLAVSSVLFLLAVQYGHVHLNYAVTGLLAAISSFWLASLGVLFRNSGT